MINITRQSWFLQPLIQVFLFMILYEFVWYLLLSNELVRAEVSWGILIELVSFVFIILSIILGVLKFYKIMRSLYLSILFSAIVLFLLFYLLSYSLGRFLSITLIMMVSISVAHIISNSIYVNNTD